MSDDIGHAFATDLDDLFIYLKALRAEEKRCDKADRPQTIHPTPLFLGLQKRCETLWQTIIGRAEAATGLAASIDSIYEGDGEMRVVVGYRIVLTRKA